MGKLTISMAMFNSYVKLPEGNATLCVFFGGQETLLKMVSTPQIPRNTIFPDLPFNIFQRFLEVVVVFLCCWHRSAGGKHTFPLFYEDGDLEMLENIPLKDRMTGFTSHDMQILQAKIAKSETKVLELLESEI